MTFTYQSGYGCLHNEMSMTEVFGASPTFMCQMAGIASSCIKAEVCGAGHNSPYGWVFDRGCQQVSHTARRPHKNFDVCVFNYSRAALVHLRVHSHWSNDSPESHLQHAFCKLIFGKVMPHMVSITNQA